MRLNRQFIAYYVELDLKSISGRRQTQQVVERINPPNVTPPPQKKSCEKAIQDFKNTLDLRNGHW